VSQAAILEAVRAELAETGWRAFSVDNVARRASASKQTIYRWWESIACLCVECAVSQFPPRVISAGDPAGRISELVAPVVSFARRADGQAVLRGALLAAADDREAREVLRTWITNEVRGPLRLIMAELAVKGVVRRDWDADDALAHLFGPIWHRIMIANSPLPEGFADIIARDFLKTFAPLPGT
jgi:AcrR family transcriptional regulator